MATYKTTYKLYNGSSWDTYYFYTSADLVGETGDRKFVPWSSSPSGLENKLLTVESYTENSQTKYRPAWVSRMDVRVGQAEHADNVSGTYNGVTGALSYATIMTNFDAKVDKSLVTTKGDIIYASAASTPARLGIGSEGNFLTVTSNGIPGWTTISKSTVNLGSVVNAGQTNEFTSADANNGNQYFTRQGAVNLYGSLIAVANGKKTTYVISSASISDTTLKNKICKSITDDVGVDFATLTLAEIKSAGILGSSATDVSSLSVGDVILIKEVDYHDIWISAVDLLNKQIKLSPLETQKYDLDPFVQTNDTLTANTIILGNGSKSIKPSVYTISNDDQDIGTSDANIIIPTGLAVDTYINSWTGSSSLTKVKKGTLGDACVKGVSTSITDGDANLVTGDAVYEHVKAAVNNTHKVSVAKADNDSTSSISSIQQYSAVYPTGTTPNTGDIWLHVDGAI